MLMLGYVILNYSRFLITCADITHLLKKLKFFSVLFRNATIFDFIYGKKM